MVKASFKVRRSRRPADREVPFEQVGFKRRGVIVC